MLDAVKGRVKSNRSSCTSHSRSTFEDGRDAHTRKGLSGTAAREVNTAGSDATRVTERQGGKPAKCDSQGVRFLEIYAQTTDKYT